MERGTHLNAIRKGFFGVRTVSLALLGIASAYASSLSGSYYTVSTTDPDFGTQCCGVYTNMVTNNLGPDGLPVLNTSYGGPHINDVNVNGEISWWSPAFDSHVTSSGTGIVMLPFSSAAMYPPQGQNPSGNDANGYLAAVYTGALSIPTTESVVFNLGSDDDSFLYLNGSLVTSVGGVHADTPAPVTSQTLAPGVYPLVLFYVDRYPSNAALDFSITTSNVGVTGTPEPATFGLFAAGILGLLGVVRARRNRADA